MKKLICVAASAVTLAIATPADAASLVSSNVLVTGSNGLCDTAPADTSPTAATCAGYFAGNVLNQANSSTIAAALSALGVAYTGNFADYLTVTGLGGATDLSSQLGVLTGLQTIGIHYGAGGGVNALGNVTAFYQIDFGTGGTLTLNAPASSSVTLFTNVAAVPEPATWAMMLLGFGAIGFSTRRKQQPRFAQIA